MTESDEHISCQEFVELVTEYLDGGLSPDAAALFEQHLNFCDGCEWYLDQLRTTIATVGRIGRQDVPEPMRRRLLAAFRGRERA